MNFLVFLPNHVILTPQFRPMILFSLRKLLTEPFYLSLSLIKLSNELVLVHLVFFFVLADGDAGLLDGNLQLDSCLLTLIELISCLAYIIAHVVNSFYLFIQSYHCSF